MATSQPLGQASGWHRLAAYAGASVACNRACDKQSLLHAADAPLVFPHQALAPLRVARLCRANNVTVTVSFHGAGALGSECCCCQGTQQCAAAEHCRAGRRKGTLLLQLYGCTGLSSTWPACLKQTAYVCWPHSATHAATWHCTYTEAHYGPCRRRICQHTGRQHLHILLHCPMLTPHRQHN
jgi:hypothetical protein